MCLLEKVFEIENEKILSSENRIFYNLTFNFAAHDIRYRTRFIIPRAVLCGKEPPKNF